MTETTEYDIISKINGTVPSKCFAFLKTEFSLNDIKIRADSVLHWRGSPEFFGCDFSHVKGYPFCLSVIGKTLYPPLSILANLIIHICFYLSPPKKADIEGKSQKNDSFLSDFKCANKIIVV